MHTVVAALRLNGVSAPAVFNGPMDHPTVHLRRASARADVTTRRRRRASNNLAVHKHPQHHAAIEAVGARSAFCRCTVRTQSDRARLREADSVLARGPAGDLWTCLVPWCGGGRRTLRRWSSLALLTKTTRPHGTSGTVRGARPGPESHRPSPCGYASRANTRR